LGRELQVKEHKDQNTGVAMSASSITSQVGGLSCPISAAEEIAKNKRRGKKIDTNRKRKAPSRKKWDKGEG